MNNLWLDLVRLDLLLVWFAIGLVVLDTVGFLSAESHLVMLDVFFGVFLLGKVGLGSVTLFLGWL